MINNIKKHKLTQKRGNPGKRSNHGNRGTQRKTKYQTGKTMKQSAGSAIWVKGNVEIFYHKKGLFSVTNAYASTDFDDASTIYPDQLIDLPYIRFSLTTSGNYLIGCFIMGAKTQSRSQHFRSSHQSSREQILFIKQIHVGLSGSIKDNVLIYPTDAASYTQNVQSLFPYITNTSHIEYRIFSINSKIVLTSDQAAQLLSNRVIPKLDNTLVTITEVPNLYFKIKTKK